MGKNVGQGYLKQINRQTDRQTERRGGGRGRANTYLLLGTR